MNFNSIIKLVGLNRVMMLCFMLSALAVFVCVHLFVIDPMLTDAQDQLSRVQGEISGLRNKINGVKGDIDYMNKNLANYDNILKQGLFEEQDRFRVVSIIDRLKSIAVNMQFSYNIGDTELIPSNDAKTMGYALIKRSIKLSSINALIDVDVFNFFQNIKDVFPLFVHIKSFSIKRTGKVDMQTLQGIATGANPNMVQAEIDFDWVTLSKKQSEDNADKGRRRK